VTVAQLCECTKKTPNGTFEIEWYVNFILTKLLNNNNNNERSWGWSLGSLSSMCKVLVSSQETPQKK
jgi:hypothetical protein